MKSHDHSSSHSAADTVGILLDTLNVQFNTANLTTGVQISLWLSRPFSMFSEPANVLNPQLLGIFCPQHEASQTFQPSLFTIRPLNIIVTVSHE